MAPGINADVEAFLRSREQQGHPGLASGDLIPDFDAIFSAAAAGPMAAPPSFSGAAPVHAAVLPFLQAFFHSGSMRPGMTAGPLPPGMELSVPDKCRVRDRSTILARQVFADRGAAFADQQVGHLLHSLNIDPAALPGGVAADGAAWDRIFHANGPAVAAENAASAAMAHAAGPSGAWATEFASLSLDGPQQAGARPQPEAWAQEFEQTKGSSWADEFREAALAGSAIRDQRQDAGAALEQTKKLAETLAANKDPKFQNSQFLQFVSKMSRGELILEDNQVKEVSPEVAAWADEFMASRGAVADVPASWEKEFAAAQAPGTDWAAEFADKLTGGGAWAEEFAGSAAQWEDEYLAELERLHSAAGPRASGDYVMSENNPFLTDTESFAKGKELFRRGVLTEAVLALEAECQRNPGNAEAWRLLGTVQAENDDDVQAIAALNRALAADPNDLDALLSLGVSHTNELEQELALSHLREWIMKHPQHAAEARQAPGPPDSSQAMLYVVSL